MFEARLFTGLSLPPPVTQSLETLLNELQPLARIRWSSLSDLHITLKFIGAFPFNRLPELARFLGGLEASPKFQVSLLGLNYFRKADKSWVLYAHVEPNERLNQLAVSLDRALEFYEIRRERGEFRPHVTLGRVPGANPWPELDARVEEYREKPLGSFEVHEYHLYESTPAGYRIAGSYPLVDE